MAVQGVTITEEDRGYDLVKTVLAKNLILTDDSGAYVNGEIVKLGDLNEAIKYTDATYTVGEKLYIIVDDLSGGLGIDTALSSKTVLALSIGEYRETAVTPTLTAATKSRLSFCGIELA